MEREVHKLAGKRKMIRVEPDKVALFEDGTWQAWIETPRDREIEERLGEAYFNREPIGVVFRYRGDVMVGKGYADELSYKSMRILGRSVQPAGRWLAGLLRFVWWLERRQKKGREKIDAERK